MILQIIIILRIKIRLSQKRSKTNSYNLTMTFALVVDHNVSTFLDTHPFTSFRKTCKTHYHDCEAWFVRAKHSVLHLTQLSDRENIGLNYLMSWALHFRVQVGTSDWFQQIVNWLEYKRSIQIMHIFILHSNPYLFKILNFGDLSARRRFTWERRMFRYGHVYKSRKWEYDCDDDIVCKKRRLVCY